MILFEKIRSYRKEIFKIKIMANWEELVDLYTDRLAYNSKGADNSHRIIKCFG